MATFRIHRMKDHAKQQFRWAPHTSGVTQIKPKDFEPEGEVDATGFYDAWTQLRGSEKGLSIGDVLESSGGELRICKYVGFEEAKWFIPEPKPVTDQPVGVVETSSVPDSGLEPSSHPGTHISR
jgi:hypothetical protein